MHQERLVFLLYMCITVSVSLGFNIDLRTPDVYNGKEKNLFGHKVLQVGSEGNKGIVVTAPLFMNGTPPPFSPKPVAVGEEESPLKHFGLAIAKDHTLTRLTVCSPNVVTRFNENSYMNSLCYNLSEQLQQQSLFKPAFQGCTKKTVNLVFLFDGSASMTSQEFESNKDFIEDVMSNLNNTSIKFAAVQFSRYVRTVFTFNDYTEGRVSRLLRNEKQYEDLTNTHMALEFVLNEHFENPANGASPEATKVLVLITDGDPSDSDRRYKIIEKYDSKNIIRFVIGVKNVDVARLRRIASEPRDNNTFHIENYNGLTGILENVQKKIFQTEGTTATLAGDLRDEMSQTGFSAVYSKDALLLGSVGSQTWRGSLHELRGETEIDIEDSEMKNDSYMGCTKKTVNLAFLFDGSASMTSQEFESNKDFIEDVMSNLKNKSIKFAAIQFSRYVRTVFTFNDYTEGRASRLLRNEKQYEDLTNTHRALVFVLNEHFENPANGASPEATKVLVLITDGDPSDSDRRYKIIDKYDSKNIIRFVIGVKNVDVARLRRIASEPRDNNMFHIENYNGLTGILENVQEKIFQTEGYSVSVGEKNKTVLYFTGAPRFSHIGQVVLFTSAGSGWTSVQRITGEQVGGYFGGELCSVDSDSDGSTDFLLVGAPLFFQPHENREGKIYIYRLTDELKLIKLFDITALAMGRFGTTIASVADVNGDGLQDVAVGAPLEDQNRGAVYLYLGDRSRGIRSTHSQRIMGERIHSGLKFFGQSIDGSMDLGKDGLPDLLIGSQRAAIVLRSKPVFNVTSHLTFEPHEINIDKIKCPSSTDEFVPLVILTICFEMMEATRSTTGAVQPGLNISYTLDVDPMRQTFRGFVNSTTKRRKYTETQELRDKVTCFNLPVYMPKCVTDTLSPISIKMNFSQVESERADAALNTDSNKETSVEIPFERRCRNNTCIAEIEVDFNFLSPTLLVGDNSYFNVSMTLFNRGEDSYNTSLTIHHPPGLSFSRMSLAQDSKSRPLYDCKDYKDRTSCGVSLPVYRGRSETKFISVFHVIKHYEWKDTLSVNITGNSDNQNSSKGSLTKDIPVQFEIKMTLQTAEDSITYINFTTEDPAPKRLVTKYKVDNHGWKAFPANVTLFFPTKLEHNFEMNNYQVQVEKNTTQCREADNISALKSEYCTPERQCKYVICDTFLLNNGSAVEFELSGEVQFKDLSKHNVPFLKRYTGDDDSVKFESFLFVSYDKQKYALDSENQRRKSERPDESIFWEDNDPTMKSSEVYIEMIVLPDKLLIIVTGAGGGLLLLIIIAVIMVKLGCFKRKLHEMVLEEEAAEEAGASNGAANHSEETKGKDDVPENKALLEKQETATSDDIETGLE